MKFRKLNAGTYKLRISKQSSRFDFGGRGDEETAEGWTSVKVTPGAKLEVLLRGPHFGVLTGKVLVDGKPLAGAKLSLHPVSEEADKEQQREQLMASTRGTICV